MKKEGFTLIELLAVIVILAIIALIAIPLIGNVIEKAKIGALKSSVNGLVESANLYYAQKQLKNDFQTIEFDCNSIGCKNEEELLEIKGKVDYGKIKIYSDGKISICVENEKNAAIKFAESDEVEVKMGSCNVSGDSYTIDELVSLNKYNELKEKYDALGEENTELKAVGDASKEEIIENKKVLVGGKEVVGIMPNIGNVTKSLNAGESYTIEKGYHDGTGKITVNTLASQTEGTATADEILNGKTAWINGSKVTGTMTSLDAKTYTPGTSNQTIASGQYLSGAQTIKGDSNLISANIKSGVSIFGVSGNSNVVDTSAGDATAAQILSGKKAYVDGKLITGTIASLAAKTYTPGTSNQTIASGKYISGTQTIKGDSNLKAANIKKGVSIFGVTGTYTGTYTIPNLEASLKVINANGWAANTSKLAAVVKIDVGSSISYNMSGASTRVVNNSDSNHLGTNLNSTYGYIDGANYIVQTNSGTTNTITGLKRGAAILEIDYGSTCGKHLIIVW